MSAPTPGWNPDPSGRHEYRYWDGSNWTDDVSDNGVTSIDPLAAAGGPSYPTDPAPSKVFACASTWRTVRPFTCRISA